jgi:Protein of unknown function (DUF3036).
MKRYSPIFLKIALLIIGIPVLALCAYGIVWLTHNPVKPEYAHIIYPIMAGLYVSSIPFYLVLFKAYQLLCYIDSNKAFSQISVHALKYIKYCAAAISVLYVALIPFVYLLAEKEDAPGLIIIGMVPVFAPMVIAVFAAVLERLLQEAIDIKSENDLTV